MSALSHQQYERGRYFDALDGLRALSVLMVLLHHMTEKRVWYWLNGFNGVAVFFVISGFLITTLCIREQDQRQGRLSLSSFYVKRFFRIVPLYLIALASYGLLTGLWAITGTWREYVGNLPYYLTFNGDLIREEGPFRISWSLGVEEKFYILWPLLLVASRWMSRGALVASTAALVLLDLAAGTIFEYPALYTGILFGCLLAFALNHEPSYRLARRIVQLPGALVVIMGAVTLTAASYPHYDGSLPPWPLSGPLSHLLSPAVAMLIAYVVIRPDSAAARMLSSGPAGWVGRRSYAIYLFHAMPIHLVDEIIAPRYDAAHVAARVAVVIALTFLVADLAHRFVETPARNYGRKLVHSRAAGVPEGQVATLTQTPPIAS